MRSDPVLLGNTIFFFRGGGGGVPPSGSTHDINKRVLRTYFLKKVVTENTQSEHLFRACTACPDTKINILNYGPRVSNGLDTDHD